MTPPNAAVAEIPDDVQRQVSKEEWKTRVDLAACYRLMAQYGWDDLVFTHISARVPGDDAHFLINPYGMMFEEITASSLVKVDHDCRKLMSNPFPVNPAGFVIHSAIHEVRKHAQCVLHTHTVDGVAVSAQRCGVLPISQQATVVLSSLGYHDYEGIALRDEEKPRLQADLGDNDFLVLRNHGLLTLGSTIADAFLYMFTLQRCCEIQVRAQAGGALIEVNPAISAGVRANLKAATKGAGGLLAWPALLRSLDRRNPGYAS